MLRSRRAVHLLLPSTLSILLACAGQPSGDQGLVSTGTQTDAGTADTGTGQTAGDTLAAPVCSQPTQLTGGGSMLEVDTSTNASGQSMVIDPEGHPVVAYASWHDSPTMPWSIRVRRLVNGRWQPLGGTLSVADTGGDTPSLALDAQGNPFLAWREPDSAARLHVMKWTGSAWSPLGGPLMLASGGGWSVSLAVGPDGNPVVAWEEKQPDNSNIYWTQLFVARWNGSAWVTLGPALRYASAPSLAIDHTGSPVLAYVDTYNLAVAQWTGSAWTPVGSVPVVGGGGVQAPALKVDGSNRLVVAWTVNPQGTPNNAIQAARWDGASWTLLGGLLRSAPGYDAWIPSVATGAGDDVVVGWRQFVTLWTGLDSPSASSTLYVWRWTQGAWHPVVEGLTAAADPSPRHAATSPPGSGAADLPSALEPTVALDASGQPLVLWQDLSLDPDFHYRLMLWGPTCPAAVR